MTNEERDETMTPNEKLKTGELQAKIEARISALVRERDEVRASVYAQNARLRAALAAARKESVEIALRMASAQWEGAMSRNCLAQIAMDAALAETPTQSLEAVRAEAGRAGVAGVRR